MEIWKDIPGYDGYQASNEGRIRSHNKTTYTAKHGIRHWNDRILKPKCSKATRSKNRYDKRVNLWKDGKPNTILVARAVAAAFLGKSEMTVNHIDGNSLNNKIDNLEYTTLADNIRKGFEQGLYSSATPTTVRNKITGETKSFPSMSQASEYLGKNHNYIADKHRRKEHENELYQWHV